ncbi:MAG: helix-turn-helix transcriptional regulator, partial [Clostridiales bacterium]|nr:helix-turn-helix transcriptional regulator [Clostridiales bacterium]
MDRDRPQFQYHLVHEDTVLESSLEEVRILLVVDGALQVSEEGAVYLLKKSDYLLVNVLEEAKLKVSPSSYIAMLSIPYFDILKASDRLSIRFRMCSLDGREGQYQEMRNLLQELVMALAGDPRMEQLRAAGLSCLILQALIDHFAVSSVWGRQAEDPENRTTQMFQYIWSHYRGQLTMTEIASRLYLSRSSASRMFRQAAGESFPEYLNRLRLRAVVEELTQTDRSITDIALGCGFSSPAVLNRTFKAAYGVSPSEYREVHPGLETESDEDERRKRVVYEIIKEDRRLGMRQGEVHRMRISLQSPAGWKHWTNRLLNVGQMASLMSARMQEQVLFLGDRLKIEYLRLWNPFSPQMMILGERAGEYNFTFLDDVLDFLADHHYKLFLDLTPRQERNMASERRALGSHAGASVFQ